MKLLHHPAFTSGVRHMLLATFWFALMNVMVKELAHLPTMELVFFRCGIASLIGFASLKKTGEPWVGSNRKLLLLRGFFGTAGLYTYFVTVQHLSLGTAVAIQYLSPIFTAVIAIYILKEIVLPYQWFFFAVSFLGVLLIKGIDTRISWQMLGIGVASSIFSALAYNMIRTLKAKEHPLVVVLHFQMFGAITGLLFTLFNWQTPIGIDWLYLILLGVFTQLGQTNLTRAFQSEKAAKVSIIQYSGIIYALIFGWFLYGETHGWLEIAGIVLIIGGVLLNIIFSSNVLVEKK